MASNKMVNPKIIITIVLMLSVIFIVGCSTSEPGENVQNNEFLPDAIEPDKPTEPAENTVVATVNDQEIHSNDVIAIQQAVVQQGQQISEVDALEEAINQEVLEQKVQEEEIVVTTQEAESMIEEQLMMQGASLEDYKNQLETQGVSYDEELENIKEQLAMQLYMEQHFEDQTFEVTEEEAQELYQAYKEQSPEEIPSFEELEQQIIESLEQQKQQEAIGLHVQELRSEATIEYK